ncbi:MAG: FAD-dependent oxidoreductase [Burkholderiaceae bacterium]
MDICVVSPHRRRIHSGMVPGWVAGHHPMDACAIALDALAARAGAVFHETAAISLDPSEHVLRCGDGSERPFDLLSIDTGPVVASADVPGSVEHALPIHPIEDFVAAWPMLVDRILGVCRRFNLVILGAGATGVELALAIQYRAMTDGWSHLRLSLVGSDLLPLEGWPNALRRRAAALLAQRGIGWLGGRRAERIEPHRIDLGNSAALDFDACLVASAAAAPPWPRAAGLATDARGFVRVAATLQSVSHPGIFATGDAAAPADARPKSDVLAVRTGLLLARNLRACCEGRTLEAWRPRQRALHLLRTGGRRAFASWGRCAFHGAWGWDWIDRLDRRFVRRFDATG